MARSLSPLLESHPAVVLGKVRGPAYASAMRPFVLRWLCISFVVGLVLRLLGSSGSGWGALLGAALFLGLINALVRPLTLRFTRTGLVLATVTMVVAINVLFCTTMGGSIPPYGFPSLLTALLGAALISLVSWPFNFFFRGSDGHVHGVTHHGAAPAPAAVELPRE